MLSSLPAIALRSWLLLLSGAMISSAMTPETAELILKSQQLFHARQYDQAISMLEQARTQAVEQKDTQTEALILNRLGLVQERTGNFIAARRSFDTAVSELSRLNGDDSPDLLALRNNLANLFYESNQPSEAVALVRRNLDVLSAASPRDSRTAAELAILSKMQMGERKPDEAGQSAEEAIRIFHESGHPEDLPAAIAYSVVGAVSEEQNAFGRAEESLKAALSILQKHLDPSDYRIAEGMANLGLLYASQGSLERAEPLLDHARTDFRAGAVNTSFVREFLQQWAAVEKKAGRKRKAKELTREAKTLLDRSSDPTMSRYTVDVSAFR
jgi:tetratricopeptide (TPR) repeat protein